MTRAGQSRTTPEGRQSPTRHPRVLMWSALVVAITTAVWVMWRQGPPNRRNEPGPAPHRHSSSLPPRVVSGYWQAWGSPNIALHKVPPQYNVIYAAFAVAAVPGTGGVTFDQQIQTPSSFVADVDALQRAGRRVVLSVGGADDGGLKIRTEAQIADFQASVSEILDRYHFSGIDWDLEHGIHRSAIARLSRELKARYGPRFLITMAPMQNQPDYEALSVDIDDVLDLVNLQFYNSGRLAQSYITEQVHRWANMIGADRVGMGFMTVPTVGDTGVLQPAQAVAAWLEVVRQLPNARGVMTWSINLDSTSGYRFASTCAPVVRGTAD